MFLIFTHHCDQMFILNSDLCTHFTYSLELLLKLEIYSLLEVITWVLIFFFFTTFFFSFLFLVVSTSLKLGRIHYRKDQANSWVGEFQELTTHICSAYNCTRLKRIDGVVFAAFLDTVFFYVPCKANTFNLQKYNFIKSKVNFV